MCENMEECVGEIREWMRNNMLKLNDDKTDVLVILKPNFSLISYMRLISELVMLVFTLASHRVTLV